MSNDLGMDFLFADGGRAYVRVSDFLVKIPYNASGIKMNQDEYATYKRGDLKEVLHPCQSLDENNWLFMSAIIDITEQWHNADNPYYVNCTKYDYSNSLISKVDCDGQCGLCLYNRGVAAQESFSKLKRIPNTESWRVGINANEECRFYSYTNIRADASEIFLEKGYLSLFEEYLEECEYDILFSEWVTGREVPPAKINKLDESFIRRVNKIRRTMFFRNKRWSSISNIW